MIKELIKIANELDKRDLMKEADYLDIIISKTAGKKKKALYLGAFLTPVGKEVLKRWWLRVVKKPLHQNEYMHHMTIKFKPTPEEVLALPIGDTVTLRIVGYAADDKGQAVLVSGVESSNSLPHITVSTSMDEETGKKVSPVYSNELLSRGITEVATTEGQPETEVLEARIGFFNGKEPRYGFEGSIYESDEEEDPILLTEL
jgi:hypothetical protein